MQPQSRGTAVLQPAKSHFRALLEGERSVKNRTEMHFYRTGVIAEDEVRSPPVLQGCISARFLLRAPKSALKCDFAGCRTAVPRLCGCIPAAPGAVE